MLLVNLGTPEATDYWSMRRYLDEFLSDRRVIETPRLAVVADPQPVHPAARPAAKGRDLQVIWNRERNESPLKTITRSQAEKLGLASESLAPIVVDWAMRYGQPPIAARLDALRQAGCDRILVVPLYPQYAAATTATVGDKAFAALAAMRWQPALRVARAVVRRSRLYRGARRARLRAALAGLDFDARSPARLVPRHSASLFRPGRPLLLPLRQDDATAARRAGARRRSVAMTFQSRFGRAEWLKPYTAETVKAWPSGVKRVAVDARLRRRLPRNARRDRRRERRLLQERGRRRALRRDAVPQ